MPVTEKRLNRFHEVLKKRQPDLCVILEFVHDPHNISAVLRSCDAVGVHEVFIITDIQDIRKHLGKRSSASALKWLRLHVFRDTASCLREVRKRYGRLLVTHLRAPAVSIYETDFTASVALAFGNEHEGISQELLDAADGNIRIPQMGMIRSLNISVACAVTLFEAMQQRLKAGYYNNSRMTEKQYQETLNRWIDKKTDIS